MDTITDRVKTKSRVTIKKIRELFHTFKWQENSGRPLDGCAVAVFSGHMIDRPDRKIPRFPAYAEEQVRGELAAIIQKHRIQIACVSCACGGDIIFMEEVLKSGGECFVLPPFPLSETIKNSVDIIPGSNWKERLENILRHENVILSESECDKIDEVPDSAVYDSVNRFLLEAADMIAQNLQLPLYGVTVWNLEKSGLPGGTDSAVALWKAKNIPVEIVTPEIKK